MNTSRGDERCSVYQPCAHAANAIPGTVVIQTIATNGADYFEVWRWRRYRSVYRDFYSYPSKLALLGSEATLEAALDRGAREGALVVPREGALEGALEALEGALDGATDGALVVSTSVGGALSSLFGALEVSLDLTVGAAVIVLKSDAVSASRQSSHSLCRLRLSNSLSSLLLRSLFAFSNSCCRCLRSWRSLSADFFVVHSCNAPATTCSRPTAIEILPRESYLPPLP